MYVQLVGSSQNQSTETNSRQQPYEKDPDRDIDDKKTEVKQKYTNFPERTNRTELGMISAGQSRLRMDDEFQLKVSAMNVEFRGDMVEARYCSCESDMVETYRGEALIRDLPQHKRDMKKQFQNDLKMINKKKK